MWDYLYLHSLKNSQSKYFTDIFFLSFYCPLGRFRLLVKFSLCWPVPLQFFLRPLIGPEIIWSVPRPLNAPPWNSPPILKKKLPHNFFYQLLGPLKKREEENEKEKAKKYTYIYWCYYPYWSRYLVPPICKIFSHNKRHIPCPLDQIKVYTLHKSHIGDGWLCLWRV